MKRNKIPTYGPIDEGKFDWSWPKEVQYRTVFTLTIKSSVAMVWNVQLVGKMWVRCLVFVFGFLLLVMPFALILDILRLTYRLIELLIVFLFKLLGKNIKRLFKTFFKSFVGKVFTWTAVIVVVLFFLNLINNNKWDALQERLAQLWSNLLS